MERESKAYTASFARIYDDIMGAVPYKLWYSYLHELIDYYQLTPYKVLELACGTGNMGFLFQQKGYQVTGIDGSADMLEVAQQKAVNQGVKIKFYHYDLRSFQLADKYDFAFSLFDSLNYILDYEDLRQVFLNVYQVLEKDGFFIFDLNTTRRLMSIEPGTTMLSGENYTCFWEDIIDQVHKRWRVRLKIYIKDSKKYHEELHEETGYPRDKVKKALTDVGFQQIDCYNAYTFDNGDDLDNRLYFIAFKDAAIARKKNSAVKILKKFKWRVKQFLVSL